MWGTFIKFIITYWEVSFSLNTQNIHDLEPSSEEIIMNASMEQNEMTKTADRKLD